MKSTGKRIFSIVLAVVMVSMLAISAFAVPTVTGAGESSSNEVVVAAATTGSVKVTDGVAGDAFNAYPVMSATYDNVTNTVTLTANTDFTDYLATLSPAYTFANYQAETNADTIKKVLGGYAQYCKTTPVATAFTLTGSTAATGVAMGQYIITGTSTEAKVFQTMTATLIPYVATTGTNSGKYVLKDTVEIAAKTSTPSITKTIPTADSQAKIGDTITYTVVATVPAYPANAINTKFMISDTLSTGLTFMNDTTFVVSASNDGGTTYNTITAGFTKTVPSGTKTFDLDFTYDSIKGYDSIKVVYTAKLNENAVITTGNDNNATLTYANDPFTADSFKTTDDDVTVYTYGIDVYKVDATDTTKKLSGVEFDLYDAATGGNQIKVSLVSTGVYKVDTTGSAKITTDTDGKVEIQGLDATTYYLQETKAAAGYAVPTTRFSFTITDAATADGIADGNDLSGAAYTTGIADVQLTNDPITINLPQTGGIGTYVFLIVGLAIMGCSVVAFAVVRKKSKNSK